VWHVSCSAVPSMLTLTPRETRLDLLRRLLSEPDGPDLQSSSGKGRRHAVLHAGCTAKVSEPVVVPADATSTTSQAERRNARPCVAA
jgi:hypothetical protein